MARALVQLLFLSIVVVACMPQDKKEETTKWKTVRSKNFSLKLPSYLKVAEGLHESAVLQYQNPVKEFYCIVIQESAAAFHQAVEDAGLQDDYDLNLDGYSSLVGDRFVENVDELVNKSEWKSVPLKGLEGKYFEANAKVEGMAVFYHYGFIKGDSTYYQVLTWTLSAKEEKFKTTMFDVLRSFKEK